jgi:hypothetical protein
MRLHPFIRRHAYLLGVATFIGLGILWALLRTPAT